MKVNFIYAGWPILTPEAPVSKHIFVLLILFPYMHVCLVIDRELKIC